MSVILETSIGDITVDLYLEERPRCCLNFLKLCKIKYYNYHLFHTVQRDFIAQTGDPTGTGLGGESIFGKLHGQQERLFRAETKPKIKHAKRGSLSMVNDGNNMHGSQFFLTLTENADFLDKQNHTVFGEVAEGFEVLDQLNDSITDNRGRPLKNVRVFHTVVLDDPIPDPANLKDLIPTASPVRNTQEQLEPRIEADEEVDDEKDLKPEEINERNKEKEAKTNAQLLEMIGDIPEADVKPPDNVLFVCKLNSVTGEEDLDTIFSRFGRILSCEVIRDKKTNESLQYAFIEFERAEDCEKAYFKMDNVLIDDRRIHVDFSQSVSKIKWNRNKEAVEKDEAKPQYRVKDFEKRNDGYEYVFDEPASERQTDKKKGSRKSSKKNQVRQRSPSSFSSEDERPTRKGKKRRSSQSSEDERSVKKNKKGHSSRNEFYDYASNEQASERQSDKKKQKKEQSPPRSSKSSRNNHVRMRSSSSFSSEDERPVKKTKKRHSSQSSDDYSSQKKSSHDRSLHRKIDDQRPRSSRDSQNERNRYGHGDEGSRGNDSYHKHEGHYRKSKEKPGKHKI